MRMSLNRVWGLSQHHTEKLKEWVFCVQTKIFVLGRHQAQRQDRLTVNCHGFHLLLLFQVKTIRLWPLETKVILVYDKFVAKTISIVHSLSLL